MKGAATPASRAGGRLALSDPELRNLAQASCTREHFENLPKLQGESNWEEWSEALQHAALIAGADAVLNGESTHPPSLEGEQCSVSEWNESIKRIAVWRYRDKGLVRAMRYSLHSDVSLKEFAGLNACQTFRGLKARYRVSDSQKLYNIYSQFSTRVTGLADSPRRIADDLQASFNNYNQLVRHATHQLLPENFLKLQFLKTFDTPMYGDWLKELLKTHNVLEMEQDLTLSFGELVNFVVAEHDRLLQEKAASETSEDVTATLQPAKRPITDVDESSDPESHGLCRLAHHNYHKRPHTDEKCYTQNPALRPQWWRPSAADRRYLADHPQLDNHQQSASTSDVDGESQSEDEAEEYEDDTSDQGSKDEEIPEGLVSQSWATLTAAHLADVQAQIDIMTNACGGIASKGKLRKLAKPRGPLSGEWLLFASKHNPGPSGHHHIWFWETTRSKQMQPDSKTRFYEGKLTIGPHGHSEMLTISQFNLGAVVTGRPTKLFYKRQNGAKSVGSITLWGDGKALITAPAPNPKGSQYEFSNCRFSAILNTSHQHPPPPPSKHDSRDDGDANEETDRRKFGTGRVGADKEYDSIIRADDKDPMVAVKVEDEDTDMALVGPNDGVDPNTKAGSSGSTPDDSENEWWEDVATAQDAVREQQNAVRQGSAAPLHSLCGRWYLYTADYYPGPDRDIYITFYNRQDHGPTERMCAPGHCISTSSQTHYCGELCFQAGDGQRDFRCLIKQFEVPEQTSLVPVRIEMWDPINKRTTYMSLWLYGGGTMRMSIPTLCIRDYGGQSSMITFAGLKHGMFEGVKR